MDKRKCANCGAYFDWDIEGLGFVRDGKDFLVCGPGCAKKAATSAGHDYAIHDKTDQIVETNMYD